MVGDTALLVALNVIDFMFAWKAMGCFRFVVGFSLVVAVVDTETCEVGSRVRPVPGSSYANRKGKIKHNIKVSL